MPAVRDRQSGRHTLLQLAERKRRVLDVAADLFVARGFAGTTVADIAKQSCVSPRLISAHFGDKTDIFEEVIRLRLWTARDLAVDADVTASLENVLLGAAKFAWATAYSPGSVGFLRLLVGEGERFAEKTSEIAKRASANFFGQMELIFFDLMKQGMIKNGDVARLAKYFVDLTVGFSLVQAGMGYWDRVPDDDELADKVKLFAQLIAA